MSNLPVTPGVTMNALKSRILNPAMTSVYSVIIPQPSGLKAFLDGDIGITYDQELMELTCMEASLPGSSLATIEVNNDYMGITEKNAYRRMYDDTMDFTFMVTQDSNYQQIRFFDSWMRYIAREGFKDNVENTELFYTRVRYPDEYQTQIQIAKYEKNLGSGNETTVPLLVYNFVDAFPKSINSTPVSYDASELLKVTVSFSYTRYYIKKDILKTDSSAPTLNPNAPGNPDVPPTQPSTFNVDKLPRTITDEYYNNGIIRGTSPTQQRQGPGQRSQDATNFTRGIA